MQADSSFYSFKKFSAGIRAGFYVNWSPTSFTSLEQNISQAEYGFTRMVFPGSQCTDTLYTTVDQKALDIMAKAGVKVLPLLTNNYKSVFRGDVVHRILNNPEKRDRLIHDIIKIPGII